jgi:cell division transport system permease protein
MSRALRPENPLLPKGETREASLFFVVAVLCFLAALAGLSVRATYSAAETWTADVEGELTLTLFDTDAAGAAAAERLALAEPGVLRAHLLSKAELDALLAPAFGARELPGSLPVPHLIAVTAETQDPHLPERLAATLKAKGYDVAVESHAAWSSDVRRFLGVMRGAAIGLVGLLAASAIAVIAFATHAALLARRDIVDVLHLAGAKDGFIARLFERRFWVLGLRAGAAGALVALSAVILISLAARAGDGRTGLLPDLQLDIADFLFLIVTPVIAGAAARLAAGFTVRTALRHTG